MTRPRIVVIGSSNTDLIVRAERIPRAGETVLGTSYATAAGGKGANQAVAAARLGADVTFVARLGHDPLSDEALAGLEREGMHLDFVVRDAHAHSGVALIVVDERGENAIAVAPGANARLSEEDVRRARTRIVAADAVLLQLEIPIATVAYAAGLAARAGVRVMLNPAPAQPLGRDLLAQLTVLTPNQREAEVLSGLEVRDRPSAERAARALRDTGVANVVITLGEAGAVFDGALGAGSIPATAVHVVDTTAAGDAFAGALAVALAGDATLVEAVRFATTAAALAVTRAGAQPSLPTLEAVRARLREDESTRPPRQ